MIDEFMIQSTASSDALQIWPLKPGVWRAALDVTDLHAEARVYERHSRDDLGLDAYFADLAQSWEGWEGAREWESLGMTMSATHDGLGNVTLRVKLLREYGEQWSAEASLRVGAGGAQRHRTRRTQARPDTRHSRLGAWDEKHHF